MNNNNIKNDNNNKNKINYNSINNKIKSKNNKTNNNNAFNKYFSSKRKNSKNNKNFFKTKYYSNFHHKNHNSSRKLITKLLIIPIGGTLTLKLYYRYEQKFKEDNISNCSTIYCEARRRNKGRGKNLVIALEEKKFNEEVESNIY